MMIMDASDALVAVFKLTIDVYEKFQLPAFLMMLAGWIYFRLWFFPIYQIKEIWVQG
jgi:hypothetical protein